MLEEALTLVKGVTIYYLISNGIGFIFFVFLFVKMYKKMFKKDDKKEKDDGPFGWR